jgi:hypothetical protein
MLSHQQGATQCTPRDHPIACLSCFHVKMKLQFLFEIAIEGSPAQPRIDPSPQFAHVSSLRFRPALKALIMRRNSVMSAPSCFRPSRVSV